MSNGKLVVRTWCVNLSDGEGWGNGRHPNALIRELIAFPERTSLAEETDRILEYVARAPFNTKIIDVSAELVGLRFLGRELRAREDSLTAHMAARVLRDKQWHEGSTKEDFLSDVRRAVLHPDVALAVYETRQTNLAGVVAPNTVPVGRRGSDAGDYIVVLYSADRGRIIAAYQAKDAYSTRIPERARWIRLPNKTS